MKNIIKFIPVILLITFFSCKKDTKDPEPIQPTPTTPTNPANDTLKVEFEHVVGVNAFALNQNFVNPNLDTFNIHTLKYYISNVVVTNTDNTVYTEANSYHLLDASDPNSTILKLLNVPVGSYKSISFTLGVDSARNCSGAQTGALDPAKGMFWSWSTGYIMFKMEGTSPQSGSGTKALTYHVGGFGGANKVQRNFNFNFSATPSIVTGSSSPYIHVSVDINEFFKTPTSITVATQFFQMSANANAKMYADNYADMIQFEHVHN